MRLRLTPLRALVLVMVAALSVVYILPVYVMMVTSLKTPLEITQRQYLLPSGNLQFGNFATALRLVFSSLVNSSVISLTVTALSVFVGGLGGYFLARFRWPVTKVLFVLLAIALYLPYQAVLIPLVRLMATTRLALTLVTPYTTTIQVKLNDIKGSYVALYNLQMAAALITVLVPLTFFLFLGKYFIRGILAGALKG